MGTTLSTTMNLRFSWTFQDLDDVGLSTPKDSGAYHYVMALTQGDGANNGRFHYRARRTLTANTGTDQLDLAGSLTDVYGNALTFVTVRAMLIENKGLPAAGNDGSDDDSWTTAAGQDLLVGGASSNAWQKWLNDVANAKTRVRSGGVLVLTAPVDGIKVTAGTGDILEIAWDGSAASGGDIEYDIILVGTR